ncbi:methyltransferase [Actinoplanes italicus]|uniref:Methyltransferase family protein n=1 Tax=Actinoplanes italicus TaxID=113567 RepID=A0A2T0K3A7_9ACTN|nr:class I SAM-dependent methyltransferase [Actinoplanes italicus]PRX17328.1 methyltransferase family protein [Actinoplanes italicus]GIE35113.1 methyltransferase [Actinoplanes italicus]
MQTNANDSTSAESFWENHYRTRPAGEARANPLLAETAAGLRPGAALDLGCGAGGDTIWLARHGWQVTAVDISRTAVERVLAQAHRLGLRERVTAEQHDLADGFPAGEFDLISAQYLHTLFALDRTLVLRAAAVALRPGGVLLIVDHGSTAPWSWNQDPDATFPTPDVVAAGLDLDATRWAVVRADMPSRLAHGPGGRSATVTDNVLVVQRREGRN